MLVEIDPQLEMEQKTTCHKKPTNALIQICTKTITEQACGRILSSLGFLLTITCYIHEI